MLEQLRPMHLERSQQLFPLRRRRGWLVQFRASRRQLVELELCLKVDLGKNEERETELLNRILYHNRKRNEVLFAYVPWVGAVV